MHPLTRRTLADVTTPARQEPPAAAAAAAVAPCASAASAWRACHARPASKYTRHHLVPLVRGHSARKNPSSTSTWPTEYKRLHLTASSPRH
ncbi:hypothetical protein COCC4DRAFT_144639 [Bipolaris maydis ATCC 48331]|uniref:Uncharacterized protein n=2 Tax=Cochliobolus heterostrophus TaxID=5016 RepID=M2UWH1_COCH5|nr:uncharacterized protein COCC4DRAFT_144639 [Bipolaris maydis ATCC 48331]EMD97866.1 hypothetical protein COCHEDRAFT_1151443 [Bipolaris maydis C5]ENI02737.1 hypothetical protein COCC4DRAFT_144639 [Bipolaris maydis ATCC 48331]